MPHSYHRCSRRPAPPASRPQNPSLCVLMGAMRPELHTIIAMGGIWGGGCLALAPGEEEVACCPAPKRAHGGEAAYPTAQGGRLDPRVVVGSARSKSRTVRSPGRRDGGPPVRWMPAAARE